jgi:LacI family transcriptional regulator
MAKKVQKSVRGTGKSLGKAADWAGLRQAADVGRESADTSTRRVLALIGWDEGYNRGILRGIKSFARSQLNWILRSVNIADPAAVSAIREWPADGLLTHLFDPGAAVAHAAHKTGKVIVNVLTEGEGFAAVVDVDDYEVGRRAAAYLVARGFEHFAIVGVADCSWAGRREAGFRALLGELGKPAPVAFHVPIRVETGRHEVGYTSQAVLLRNWLAKLPASTGLFAVNDPWGREVAEGCRLAGIAVPEAIAIVGADNDDLWCEMAQPELSSVEIPWRRIGYEAAAALNRAMSGASHARLRRQEGTIYVGPGEVVTRQSSDILAVRDERLAEVLSFIRARTNVPLTVADLLRHLPVERRWLERKFRTVLGRSPLREIRRTKIERARSLLARTELAIPEVARQCGISEKEFAAVFGLEMGMTPSAFRRNARIGLS